MKWISRPLVWRSLSGVWMATIFILSAQPSLPVQGLFAGQDKIEHFLAYGLLGVLLSRSIKPMKVATWRRIVMITALTMLYGISDEYHQSFVPGRDVSALDVLADGMGGFLAAWMLFWMDCGQIQISRFFPFYVRGEGRGEG